MEPYYDPLHDQLDSLEASIERTFDPGLLCYLEPDGFMDPLGRDLSSLEVWIEGREVRLPAFEEPEPPLLSSPSDQPALRGPLSEGPPALSEPVERPWIGVIPAPAARPFFTREGLTPFSYCSRARAGTRSSIAGASALTRWCPEANEFVTEETCLQCDNWGDHGARVDECSYDSLERNQADKLEDEEDEY